MYLLNKVFNPTFIHRTFFSRNTWYTLCYYSKLIKQSENSFPRVNRDVATKNGQVSLSTHDRKNECHTCCFTCLTLANVQFGILVHVFRVKVENKYTCITCILKVYKHSVKKFADTTRVRHNRYGLGIFFSN